MFFQSTTCEIINLRRRIETLEIFAKNQIGKNEKIDLIENQINQINKEFTNSSQMIKNFEVYSKEIVNLKEKTNNLAIQVII